MRGLGLLPFATAVALSGSCSLDVPQRASGPPRLRLVNASATADVTAHLHGNLAPLLSIPVNSASAGCVLIFPGEQEISFMQAATTLAAVARNYDIAGKYTVILVKGGTTFRAVALDDSQNVVPGNNGLRFINATSSAGDVYVTPPGADPGAAFLAVGNLGRLALSNDNPVFVQRAETDVRVRLFDVGTTTTARADITLAGFFDDRLATIVFMDPSGSDVPGEFLVYPCQ